MRWLSSVEKLAGLQSGTLTPAAATDVASFPALPGSPAGSDDAVLRRERNRSP